MEEFVSCSWFMAGLDMRWKNFGISTSVFLGVRPEGTNTVWFIGSWFIAEDSRKEATVSNSTDATNHDL